ncbi:MAG TPA: TolC family protein [Gemmatimonadaceae bacterium]|nr:TolC family protein [Gemmatimonadaceae bacterium]
MKWLMWTLLVPAALSAQAVDTTTPRAAVDTSRSIAMDTTARPIALDEAVRLAQRNAPAAVQARGQLRTGRAGIRSSYFAFVPNISLSAGSTRQAGDRFDPVRDEVVSGQTTWQYGDGYNLNLTLFDGGRRIFDIGAARANFRAAEANEVTQEFTVALDVKREYYNVLAARESEAAAAAQLEQAEQQLRAASARVMAGVATRSDSLRSVIQVGNARLALLTARNNYNAANAALTRLVATPFVVTAMPEDTLQRVVLDVDSVRLADLAENGPAVRQAQAQHAAARAGERAARTPYLPTISANYNWGRSASASSLEIGGDPLIKSNSLRLSVSFPVFDQFQREEAVVRASVAEDNARAALRDARLASQQQLIQFVGSLRTAEERVGIQTASVAAAEEDLRVQSQRYAVGASTLLDVLTSQTQLNQARSDLIQARYDYRIAKAQIEALIGRTL